MILGRRAHRLAGVLLLCGCSSDDPFDAASADLQGGWVVTDETVPKGGLAPGGITNLCRLTNVPYTLRPSSAPGIWTATQEVGGSLQCEVNGMWGEPTAPPQASFEVVKEGAGVQWILSGRFSYYVGTLTSADRMNGAVDPDGYGREGSWRARRR